MDKISRRHQQNYEPTATRFRNPTRHELRGRKAYMTTCACLAPVLFGFLIPAWVLADYAIIYFE